MKHFDHAAAVRCAAVPCRADEIGVRGNVIRAAVQENAAIFQLFIRQFRVVAQKDNGAIIPQRLGYSQPCQTKLIFKRFRSADIIDRIRQIPAAQIADGRIRAGQKIVGKGFNAEPGHFGDIRVCSARGIVRQEQVPAADGAHIAQKVQRAVEERFTQIDRAVHVQQEQPFFRKRHCIPPWY